MVDTRYNQWGLDFPWTQEGNEDFSYFDDLCDWAPGWIEPIYNMCIQINIILENNPNSSIHVEQVKEKFGDFIFFYTATDDIDKEIREAVDICEQECANRCIKCGSLAPIKLSHFWARYCKNCYHKIIRK